MDRFTDDAASRPAAFAQADDKNLRLNTKLDNVAALDDKGGHPPGCPHCAQKNLAMDSHIPGCACAGCRGTQQLIG